MTKEKRGSGTTALAANALGFALGVLSGFYWAGKLGASGDLSFSGWMSGYQQGFSLLPGVSVPFWEVLWSVARWPILVWFLGMTGLGVWMVPIMFVLRGFLLSFCVAGLSGAAQGGALLAFLLFGCGGLVTLPILFLLGGRAWGQAAVWRGRGRILARPAELPKSYYLSAIPVFGCILCCAGMEYWMLPKLLRQLAPIFGGN